jgi:hypothetical protein
MNVKLSERIERVFSTRPKLAQVRLADEVIQLDDDEEDALWFSGRDWHELTWQNWQEHSDAIFFFDPEAFAYYLPSILLLSAQNPNESLNAADSLIGELDPTPDPEAWSEAFVSRFLELNLAELDTLTEWLLQVCEYIPYRGSGIAASGPGDTIGRAFDTVHLLRKEVERRRLSSG